jgi:hypothetical protein
MTKITNTCLSRMLWMQSWIHLFTIALTFIHNRSYILFWSNEKLPQFWFPNPVAIPSSQCPSFDMTSDDVDVCTSNRPYFNLYTPLFAELQHLRGTSCTTAANSQPDYTIRPSWSIIFRCTRGLPAWLPLVRMGKNTRPFLSKKNISFLRPSLLLSSPPYFLYQ